MTRFENGKALLSRDTMNLIINAGLTSIIQAHNNPDLYPAALTGIPNPVTDK